MAQINLSSQVCEGRRLYTSGSGGAEFSQEGLREAALLACLMSFLWEGACSDL